MKSSDIPAKFTIPFGNSAAALYITTIPTASQIGIQNGAASLTDGFPPLAFVPPASGGAGPFGTDFNGILKQITQWSRWQNAGATVVYDGTFATAIGGYPKGTILASTTAGGLWISTADDNVTDPDAAGAGWVGIATGAGTGFAALAGSSLQVFSVAAAVTASQAVNLGQAAIPARTKLFKTSGTWTVPAGITTILATGCAGGAGGNNLASGGAGQPTIKQSITVVPGDILNITIGAAGVGGYPAGTAGGNTTIVDSTTSTTLLTLTGATGPTGSASSIGYPNGGGLNSSGQAYHQGASGPFGGGGAAAGPASVTQSTLNAYGYGAGGGQQEGSTPAGNGAPGLMILEW